MTPLTLRTIHHVDGSELDAWITAETGHVFDPVKKGDVRPLDESPAFLHVAVTNTPSEEDLFELEWFKQYGKGSSRCIITGFIASKVRAGSLPAGEYHIIW